MIGGHDQHYAIDSSKLIRELSWQPELDLKKGICMTVDWYLNNQTWLDSLKQKME